ncbi:MAG: GNAT family N-acetyltransferase [Isosphaeraceae bacterium]|nr:GNAT family N-acetyltransferase [Isosphaeraceae bacterium]
MPLSPIRFEACPPDDRAQALAMLYQRLRAEWRQAAVEEALEEVEAGTVDLSCFWVARRGKKLVGVMLTQILAGRAAAVWPPEVEKGWSRRRITDGLVSFALERLRERGILVAQALLDPSSIGPHAAEDLNRGGLARVTTLTYLDRATSNPFILARNLPRFEWHSFSDRTEPAFRNVIEATYRDSLDMPELEDVRSIDRVRETQLEQNRFDPARWQLGLIPGEPDAAAILLMSDIPERNAWEVSYLGLTPQARRRGLGRAIIHRALQIAAPCVPRIELAVDERNTPAERLYASTGFLPFDSRVVHIALLGRADSP